MGCYLKVYASLVVTVLVVFVGVRSDKVQDGTDNNVEATARNSDSYMSAYSKTSQILHNGQKVDRDSSYYPGSQDDYSGGYYQNNEYLPPNQYGPPKNEYGPPKTDYGPPKVEYGPPKMEYGPPKPIYGPPSYYHHVQSYNPPEQSSGIPYSMFLPGLLDKLKFKLNLFTVGKIILKLVIFKKIVSLIAILCLLLFIPSLKHHENKGSAEEEEEEMRKMNDKTDDHINTITQYITESIEHLSQKYDEKSNKSKKCGPFCKGQIFLKYLDKNLPYRKLTEEYLKEEN